MDRKQFQTSGILAEDICISQDTWRTQINNNVLVVGPSGAGKTRSYVKPNILQANTNMIVSDAKGARFITKPRLCCAQTATRYTSSTS